MADYISLEAMHKANQDEWQGVYGFVDCDIFEDNENMIDRVPSADVVARDCYDRILAENDTMREMLARIGKKCGDSMDDVRPVPPGGIGEMSDGYHTFNGLYYQRMVLFAALVKQNKDSAWKSHRHEDGELCFGGGWFIVGLDTPKGSYTYHYEDKDWDLFDCEELPVGKHWDGHTEDDVTRLLSLPEMRPVVRAFWAGEMDGVGICSNCKRLDHIDPLATHCRFCGAEMIKG